MDRLPSISLFYSHLLKFIAHNLSPAKKQAEKQKPTAIASVIFQTLIFLIKLESECPDGSMQRKAQNLNVRVELR